MLSSRMRGKPLVYLDNAATSLTPEPVIERMNRYYREYGVNIHRGIYEFSERATREYEQVRVDIARFLNSPEDAHIIFTHGATESANLIAYGWGRKFLRPGDIVLSTEYEHHSTLVPWHAVCEAQGAKMAFIPIIRENLTFDLDAYYNLLNERVKILVLSAMSNVTGYMPPLREIIAAAHANNTLVLLDGAQLVSHHPVDIQELNPDFLFFSAHKMLGPTGVGILWSRTSLMDSMDPFMYGGNMILRVHKDHSTYHPLPQKFEAGTPNIAGVLGAGAAIEYLERVGMKNIETYEHHLIDNIRRRIADMDSSFISYLPRTGTAQNNGEPEDMRQGGIFSFNIAGLHSHDIGALLDAQGIAVRSGFHCAMPLMDLLGVPGTVRASFYFYNTEADIDALFSGLQAARDILTG